MPSRSFLFILLIVICFFMQHTCHARRFGVTTTKFHKTFSPNKIEGKLKFSMNFVPNVKDTNERMLLSRGITVNSQLNKADVLYLKKKNGTKGAKSGSEEDCTESCLQKVLLNVPTSKGSRWPRDDAKDHRVLHPSIFSNEDIMQTDYQPPHRKPPIHNK